MKQCANISITYQSSPKTLLLRLSITNLEIQSVSQTNNLSSTSPTSSWVTTKYLFHICVRYSISNRCLRKLCNSKQRCRLLGCEAFGSDLRSPRMHEAVAQPRAKRVSFLLLLKMNALTNYECVGIDLGSLRYCECCINCKNSE